jgi:hypothetical protein
LSSPLGLIDKRIISKSLDFVNPLSLCPNPNEDANDSHSCNRAECVDDYQPSNCQNELDDVHSLSPSIHFVYVDEQQRPYYNS